MATYQELQALRIGAGTDALVQKIVIAICVKANAITKNVAATPEQKVWAKQALGGPDAFYAIVLNYIIADYNTAAIADIQNATDTQVQMAVDAAVDTLLGA